MAQNSFLGPSPPCGGRTGRGVIFSNFQKMPKITTPLPPVGTFPRKEGRIHKRVNVKLMEGGLIE